MVVLGFETLKVLSVVFTLGLALNPCNRILCVPQDLECPSLFLGYLRQSREHK